MSDTPRSLPGQPSLRYLKVEAKRRLAAGEFETLHDAQLAIAREHGLLSWNALRQAIEMRVGQQSHALKQVNWLISRFNSADYADWAAPSDGELREHIGDRFLSIVTPQRLVSTLAGRAAELREEPTITLAEPLRIRARVGGMQIEAVAEPEAPHRLGALRVYPVGSKVYDGRIAAPSTRTWGEPRVGVTGVAEEAFAELGLVGLALSAGSRPADTLPADALPADTLPADTLLAGPGASWVTATGWAGLDSQESNSTALRPDHRFPAYSVTKLITVTTVLHLVADGSADLDRPANDYLRTVRLSDCAVTVRDLLSHRGGVSTPFGMFAGRVPALADLAGPLLPCTGHRGEYAYSNGGYAALGQLIEDITGAGYREVATRVVLEPLGMTSSFFPESWPGAGPDTVAGYVVTDDGSIQSAPQVVCTIPAAGGLWATPADLVRFGISWGSLLPEALVTEALTPQSVRSGGIQVGLGWHLNIVSEVAGHPGGGAGGATSLVLMRDQGRVHVAMTNRRVAIEPVNSRVIRLADAPE
jgi:CubicO group peptidase (beta-lactamase class C family)